MAKNNQLNTVIASKSDQNTASSTTTTTAPADVYNNPAAFKAWVQFVPGASPTVNDSFNVTSVVQNGAGTGLYDITLSKAMGNTTYGVVVTAYSNSVACYGQVISITSSTVFTIQITRSTLGTAFDPTDIFVGVIGHSTN